MTQEEKQLLLKDLCARLPYGVKCYDFCYNDEGDIVNTIETLECIYPSIMEYKYKDVDAKHDIERIKPYLRPMSSMTEEEKKEIEEILEHSFHVTDKGNIVSNDWRDGAVFTSQYDAFKIMDFCNKHHLDYRGLIKLGLALEAPENMYNTKTE